MADKMLMTIDAEAKWSLKFDSNQWVISRLEGKGVYRPLKFVGSNTTTLRRTIAELGIEPTAEADAEIASWAPRFLDWHASHKKDAQP